MIGHCLGIIGLLLLVPVPMGMAQVEQGVSHSAKHLIISVGAGEQVITDAGHSMVRYRASFQTGIHLLSIRYVRGAFNQSAIPVRVYKVGSTPEKEFSDVALMYGIGTPLSPDSGGLSVSVNVGISSASGTETWVYEGMSPGPLLKLPVYDARTFTGIVGIPIETEVRSNRWWNTPLGGESGFCSGFESPKDLLRHCSVFTNCDSSRLKSVIVEACQFF